MNMTSEPTAEQLAGLLGNADDQAGHHILWVSKTGNVNLTCLIGSQSPGVWSEENEAVIQFRFGTYEQGNGYVGVTAAADPEHVQSVFRQLVDHWTQGDLGLMDY